MRETLFIRFCAPSGAPVSWLRQGAAAGASGNGELGAAAAIAASARVIVFVPATEVLLIEAKVPTRQRQRMSKAVPFALEEQIIADVDTLHFALGQPTSANSVPVAVVSQTLMQSWLDDLQSVGLQAEAIIADNLVLPLQPDSWSMLSEEGQVSVRTANDLGFGTDSAQCATVMQSALLEAGDAKPKRLHVFGNGELPVGLAEVAEQMDVILEQTPCQDTLELLARHYSSAAINLMQGSYSRNEQLEKLWKPWRVSAALMAIWLTLGIAAETMDYFHASAEQTALQQEIERFYKQTFPGETKIVDARAQMQQHLKALQGGGDQSGFLELLAGSAPILLSTPQVEVKSLRSQGKELEIELELKDLQVLDQLKQRLTDQAPVEVDIVSAAAREDKVEGRLKIRGKT